MDPETDNPTPLPASPAPAPPPLPSPGMEEVLKAITEMQAQLSALAEENAKLRAEVSKSSGMDYAEGVPAHLRRGDPAVDPRRMSVARSVTVATRPVIENPEQYRNVVAPGGLSINTGAE
jgi:hypothetical protein